MTAGALSTRRCRPNRSTTWQERRPIRDRVRGSLTGEQDFESLTLPETEEAGGELHRRIAVALRRIGEQRADAPDAEGRSPRWRAVSLAAAVELAAAALGAIAADGHAPADRSDLHPATVGAVMYAAPTLSALLTRLQQDRRLLASLARALESRLDEEHSTPWGRTPLRRLVAEVALAEPARCAQALERRVGEGEA